MSNTYKIKLMPLNMGHDLPSNGILLNITEEQAIAFKFGNDSYSDLTYKLTIEEDKGETNE